MNLVDKNVSFWQHQIKFAVKNRHHGAGIAFIKAMFNDDGHKTKFCVRLKRALVKMARRDMRRVRRGKI